VSKFKNVSRAGWVIVVLVTAILLVPTMAVAATIAYNGIEGTNGTTTTQNKAFVTSAGQLLTTEVQPSKYEEYGIEIDAAGNQGKCLGAVRVPTGDAFIADQVNAYVYTTDVPTTGTVNSYSTISVSGAFSLIADNPSQTECQGDVATDAGANSVGNLEVPLTPGYVFPSGYGVDIHMVSMDAVVFISGYLVPSADAPSTPTNMARYALPRP